MVDEQIQNNEEIEFADIVQGKQEKTDQPVSEVEKLQKELSSQKDLFLRVAAEYDNYRKRTDRDKTLIYSEATANAVMLILPVADSLELAQKALVVAPTEYKKGVDLVIEQLNSSFEKIGVEPFGAEGDSFNPDIHNAVAHVDDDSRGESIVAEVFQKGYRINDKIIRHAMVKVAN